MRPTVQKSVPAIRSLFTRSLARTFCSKPQTFDYGVENTGKSTNIVWSEGLISREERIKLTGKRGATVWLTGLSGSGKSTVACALEHAILTKTKNAAYRLDGDNIRFGLNKDLGFSDTDRTENIRRIGEVAKLFSDSGMVSITAFISPYKQDRDAVREQHNEAGIPFIEVVTEVPLEVAESRDPKGLYKKARAGLIKGFTGIDDPYEAPDKPEIVLRTDLHNVDACVDQALKYLQEHDIVQM